MVVKERYYHPVDPEVVFPGFIVDLTRATFRALACDRRNPLSGIRYGFFSNSKYADLFRAHAEINQWEKKIPLHKGKLVLGAGISKVSLGGVNFDHQKIGIWVSINEDAYVVPLKAVIRGDRSNYPKFVSQHISDCIDRM